MPKFKAKPGISFGYNTPMDFFPPEDDLQRRMAPEEMRITSLSAEQYPDGLSAEPQAFSFDINPPRADDKSAAV